MRKVAILLALAIVAAGPARVEAAFVDAGKTVSVDPSRGIDPRVDYASLLRFGPWDDRNYRLTLEDLAALAPNEAELRDAIPAFFRVRMRQAWPTLPRTGPAQYPRHALPIFLDLFGGYLVDGRLYRGVRRVDGRLAVVLDSSAPAAGPDAAGFVSGEVRVTSPVGAAESSIKVHPLDPNKVVAATNGPDAGQTMHYSTDGGATWTEVLLPLGGTNGDPAVDWSSDGAHAYTTTLGKCSFVGCAVWFYRSDDGGATWNGLESVTPGDPRREITTRNSDKEYLHVDKSASSPYKDRVYVTWHESNVLQFAVSTDLGNTFTTQSFSSATEERGIGSDITTDAAGKIYYLWPAFNSRTIRLKTSSDGGVTFAPSVVVATTQAAFSFPVPSMESREAFVYVSADADLGSGPYAGSVYAAWTDSTASTVSNPSQNHARIQVAYSRDGGATWSVSTPHETADEDSVDRYHPWLGVGPDGTVHVVFYDTRRDPTRSSVDLFYAYSTDGAATWSTPSRVTTVQSPNIADGFEFGDYNGLDVVLDDLIAIFTDNRDESGGTAESVDVYAAGIPPGGPVCGNGRIDPGEACDGADVGGKACVDYGCTGGALQCAADCGAVDTSACTGCAAAGAGRVPDGDRVPGEPLRVEKSGADLTLTWSAACGPGDDYAVYEGEIGLPGSATPRLCSTGGATSATLTPSAGARFYLVVPTSGGSEGSYGYTGDGAERGPSAAACLPQAVAGCN